MKNCFCCKRQFQFWRKWLYKNYNWKVLNHAHFLYILLWTDIWRFSSHVTKIESYTLKKKKFFIKWNIFAKMWNLDRMYISQFFYFQSRNIYLLCHDLLKHKPSHNFQRKIYWRSGFKGFTREVISFMTQSNKHKITNFENST